MKKCWKCAEEIQDAAVACRFCNTNQASLEKDRLFSTAFNMPKRQVTDERLPPAKNSFQSCMGCAGWVIIGILALGVLGSEESKKQDAINAAADVP